MNEANPERAQAGAGLGHGPEDGSAAGAISMRRILGLGIGVRLLTDTGVQIFGPFLAVIAAGLGTNIVTLGALNSLRSLTGLAAPAIGSLAGRIGYRPTMRWLLLLGAAGNLIFAASRSLITAAVGVVVMGLCLFTFASILQAYMSAHIPYARRARGLGLVENAWALSGIVGLSLSGLLIARFGWRAPFIALGVGMLFAALAMGLFPATPRVVMFTAGSARSRRGRPSRRARLTGQVRQMVRLEEHRASAWSAIGATGLSVFAIAHVNIVYGAWLGREYALSTTQLGLVALLLGIADLGGSLLVTVSTDRLGKYRSMLGSTLGAALAFALLPFLNTGLAPALVGLFAARFLFEVDIVSGISLLSEQVPAQRGQVLTLAAATVTIGVAAAGITGPFAYNAWGVAGLGGVSAAAALCAAVLLIRVVTERAAGEEAERMTDIVKTEWSGHHQDKDALRSTIWRRLEEAGASPREPFGHIPSFVGAEDAAARLAELPIWQQARVIKSNPDTAHAALRLRALQEGKRLYMAVPRLTEARCFVELTADAMAVQGVALEDVAAWPGAMAHGRLVSPEEMPPIDLVLVGCVAVTQRGARIGKGAGFADLELGMLREYGLVATETPVATAVHPLQLVPEGAIPMMPHDSPLDWIIMPDETLETHTDYPRPAGLEWAMIRPEQIETIPFLRLLRDRRGSS